MAEYQGFYNGVPLSIGNSNAGGDSDLRPSDWLPMPKPDDDEIYMLVHVPENLSTPLCFVVECDGSYTIDIGTVMANRFVSFNNITTVESGNAFETILHSEDCDTLTSDGMMQAMIKITGNNITSWNPKKPSDAISITYCYMPIVDIRCRLPNGSKFKMNNYPESSSGANVALTALRYFSWEGPNKLEDATYMFYYCYGLFKVIELDTSMVKDASSMFYGCYMLNSIPEFDLTSATTTARMFYNCYSMREYPYYLDTKNVEDMSDMFRYNMTLRTFPKFDSSNAKNTSNMFYSDMCLKTITNLNIQHSVNVTNMFYRCDSVAKVTFDPTVEKWSGYDISFASMMLGHEALVELFESLPTITTRRTLTITKNYGIKDLTEEEKKIATDKQWVLQTS